MSEQNDGNKIYSLHVIRKIIHKMIVDRCNNVNWIMAEMNKLNYYPHVINNHYGPFSS